jgi:Ankyrin repeats (3 copies)
MTAPCDMIELHEAYRRGDLEAVKAMLGDPPDFPNCPGPYGVGEIVLEYAIYHSPLGFIRKLLELGADPNYQDRAGFPSLIAALSCGERQDMCDILELLLTHGADIQQRGVERLHPAPLCREPRGREGDRALAAPRRRSGRAHPDRPLRDAVGGGGDPRAQRCGRRAEGGRRGIGGHTRPLAANRRRPRRRARAADRRMAPILCNKSGILL